jgi:hypothetical protein
MQLTDDAMARHGGHRGGVLVRRIQRKAAPQCGLLAFSLQQCVMGDLGAFLRPCAKSVTLKPGGALI